MGWKGGDGGVEGGAPAGTTARPPCRTGPRSTWTGRWATVMQTPITPITQMPPVHAPTQCSHGSGSGGGEGEGGGGEGEGAGHDV